MNAADLEYVSIPESVKLIGENAFTNTALKSVCIARDCVFYPTTFPEDCQIWYYDDEILPDDFEAHIADEIRHITGEERTGWNGKLDSDSALTNAEIEALLT